MPFSLTQHTLTNLFSSRKRMVVLVVMFLMAALSLSIFTSSAANPSGGTLSVATPRLTYQTGPNVQSNPTAQSGTLICNAAFPCDDYALTVSVPAGYATTHNVVITIQWPVAAEDYDLYVLNSTGTVIKTAASSADPEIAIIDAVPGTYTIRVVPFAVAGSTFTGTIELLEKPTSTPPDPPGPGTPRYHNFAAPGTMGNNAGEPSLGVGKSGAGHPDGRTMYIAGLETLRVTWDDCSSPAKPLWEDKSFVSTSLATLDPILFTDFATGRTLVSQLGPKTSFIAYTDNDGGEDADTTNDYLQSQGSGINSGVDHQTVGGGPFRPGLPDGVGYANAVYYASQDVAVAQMALSRDGGQTFGPAVPMYNLTQCGGLHGHIKVAPDGTVYLPNKGCGTGQGVVVSEDEGLTFTVRTVPGSSPGDTDPSVGIDASGKVYFAYADGDGHAKVAVSSNKGATWSTPIDVGSTFGIENTVFPAAVGGSANRASVMYLATDTDGGYEATGVFTGVWHIYASHTFDGGQTWTTVRVTPENDPVQRGSICTSGTTCGEDRNLLDFNDMTIDHEGRVLIAYADGCIGCTSPTGADSRAAKATIARQSGGKRMLAGFGPEDTEPNPPAAPLVNSVVKDANGVVKLRWSAPDNGGAPLTAYNIYRKVGAAGVYGAPLATVTADKTTYDDTTALPNTQYFYKVTAVNSEGEGPSCGDFPVGEDPGGNDPCTLPGVEILSDQAGDIITPIGQTSNPGWDLRSLSIAEPFGFAPDKLVFTIKVEDLTVVPANTRWPVQFKAPGATTTGHWVDMRSDPTQPTGVSFKYGTFTINPTTGAYGAPSTVLGDADAGSTYSPDGTITIVISNSKIGSPTAGQSLTGFLIRVRFGTDLGAVTPDNMDDSLAPLGSYTLVGNAFCRPNTAPIARLTATPNSGPEPLLVTLDASASSDADTDPPADTIVSYTFKFGDGEPDVTTSSAIIQHTYDEDGVYRATVSVTDSRGKTSINPAEAIITVTASGPGTVVNYAVSSRGSSASASSTATERNYATANAIDGDNTGVGWEQGGGWNDNTRDVWPDWFDVTFGGGAKTISEIRVFTLQDNFNSAQTPTPEMITTLYGLLDFDVQYWTGTAWATVPGGEIRGNDRVMRIISFPELTTTKIRINVIAARHHHSRIVEVEAYGAPGQ